MSAEIIQSSRKSCLSDVVSGIPDNVDELEPFFRSKPMFIQMDEGTYFAGPGIGSSALKTADISMEHFYVRHVLACESKETQAMKIGRLCHLAILEGPRFRERFRVKAKVDGRTKEGKAYLADFEASLQPEDIVVSEKECDMIVGMVEALLRHPMASWLLSEGSPELAGYCVDEETGLLLKMKADFMRKDGIIIDYKTTIDAKPDAWEHQARRLGYHIQAAHYRNIANVIMNTPLENSFAFIAQEKEPPYAVYVHEVHQVTMECGQKKVRRLLNQIANCYKKNEWPGYPIEANAWILPDWAIGQEGAIDEESIS